MSSNSDNSISSGSLRFLQLFSLTAPIEFPNVRDTEKGLKPPLVLSLWDSFFSLRENYLANPNGEGVRNGIANHISKFHENLTVNKVRIIVLLRPFWVSAEMEKATMRKIFLTAQTWYLNSQWWEFSGLRTWCLNFTKIQRWMNLRSSFFWDRFGGQREKERVLRGEKRRMKMRRRGDIWLNIAIYT